VGLASENLIYHVFDYYLIRYYTYGK